ncbi:VOC family protein [Taibaiella lutea]|uniref:VOC family protein n=1 Tax=Taibaiella lutea TaxID=2608001 RepID=A0A5M6CQM2_9BACT|nr:VOC family protein [Taibaiella lutea]KAA5537256.1 VOC family protein [Taibaiella lutea]
MAKVSIYLNFQGNTEEAFNFYKDVFKTEFIGPVMKMKDVPVPEGMPPLSEQDANSVMHVCLPILGGTNIMGTDMLESMGHKLVVGNNTTINLEPDSKEEADRLYNELSQGATDCAPMRQEFWGYWGCCLDRFGIRWMFNYSEQQ